MNKGITVIGRAISFFFGFLAGRTGSWTVLAITMVGYIIIFWLLGYIGKSWDIPLKYQ